MIKMDLERRKFEELLPFYVNKTLDSVNVKFMENYLAMYPELQAQVIFTETLSASIKEDVPERSPNHGWDKLLKRYKAFHAKPTFGERLKSFLNEWGLSPAFGLAFGLLVAQSAVMLQYDIFTSGTKYRGLTTQAEIIPHLKIIINPNTDYAQLVDLLRKNGCKVVSGPSENGELWIHLQEPDKLITTKEDLINSGLVDEALSLVPDQK